jgi:DNA-directed RNA polymerase specialized sigma24 family protein
MFRLPIATRARDLRSLADEDLIALVDTGESRAFETILDRHAGIAWTLAYRMCGRQAVADAVVHDAFLSLWHGTAGYDRARGSVRAWVLTVVYNRATEALRRDVTPATTAVPSLRQGRRTRAGDAYPLGPPLVG